MENGEHSNVAKFTFAGLLVTIGIIYGDIGTSVLYVMKAIVGEGKPISADVVLGGISCVFWTLTFQTTIKYVLVTLRADNNGEGGIFSLFTLVRRHPHAGKWLVFIAVLGGAALLADGMITPPISVSSAIEGLRFKYPNIPTVPITIAIITLLFLFQRFGTSVVGKAFGPVMLVWFSMLAVLGVINIMDRPEVLAALSPHYAINLLMHHKEGFVLLGAVFLCTTGAEALYSDLGHCGRQNIRISWIFVKISLVLNYCGQGAWLLGQEGTNLTDNPFYAMMPPHFRTIGIVIATMATIIASQALISGSFTLISEAIRLNLFPKVQVKYPSNWKGQIYISSINYLLLTGCIGMVLYFRESTNMEAAYGLSITITMLMTTILLYFYLQIRRVPQPIVILFVGLYVIIEMGFLGANLLKFFHGGYITMLVASGIVFVMWVWHRAHVLRYELTEYVSLREYLPQLKRLSSDTSVPKYATHAVFLSASQDEHKVEKKIMYSILQKQPKRADMYWFVHIEVTDEPYTSEYKVSVLDRKPTSESPDGEETYEYAVKILFRLGFRMQQRINWYLRIVIEQLLANGEIDVTSQYTSFKEQGKVGDFRFIIIEETLSQENDLPFMQEFVMNTYFTLKGWVASPQKWFGLDTSTVDVEQVPLVIRPAKDVELTRIM